MDNSSPENTSYSIGKVLANTFRALIAVISVGIIVASLFTAATPLGLIPGSFAENLDTLLEPEATQEPEWPTATPRPNPRIGIVVGHWGDNNDPGAVCPDGLTEFQVNQIVADLVQRNLQEEGFDVDLLKEFDPKLDGYVGLALISIHADSCTYINDQATGFKVAATLANPRPERSARLSACIVNRYQKATGLNLHQGVTPDMTSYHAFNEIDPDTTAVIIETGFLNLDRQILTQQPARIARGITNGITCFIYNEDISPIVTATNEP